jgi:glycosyltransferase involved in cell wall biosynthesis
VLYAYWNAWGTAFDKELILSKKWKAVCVGGNPINDSSTYLFSRLLHKVAKSLNKLSGGRYLPGLTIARADYHLTHEARKHQADLYIAHNLGALPAAVKAAKANKKPCGFDAEDFHRFEVSDDKSNPDVILKIHIEDRYIPQLDYLTASSPLIAKAYEQLYPDKKPVAILNVFPENSNIKPPNLNAADPIRLFWFSQTIGLNRGIEDVLSVLSGLKDQAFELHLLGHLPAEAKDIFSNDSLSIYFHEPVAPDDIIPFASQFDIGLATEDKTPLNRDICLTNKIFTYIQAGLAVIASDTSAQQQLFNEYPGIGKTYQKGNIKTLTDILLNYHQNRQQLFETQKAALLLAREKLNWETEKEKFLSVIKEVLNPS